MKNRWMVLATILLFCSIPVYSQTQPDTTLSFPQLADGPLGNSTITSTIGITNPNNNAANINLQFYNRDGTNMTLRVNVQGTGIRIGSTVSFSIPRGGSALVMTTGESASLVTGWAKATSNVPVAGTLEYETYDSQFTLLTQAGWGISRPLRMFQIAAFRDFALGSTGVAWSNPGNMPATINGILVNAAGTVIQRKTFVLNPNNQQARFLFEAELFDQMPRDGFTGTAYFTSTADVAPVGLLISNSGIISGLAVVQLSSIPSF